MSENQEYRQLIEGCLAKDKRSWDRFVDRFSKLIYWSIHKTLSKTSLSGSTDLSREIFQDIFRRLIEKNSLNLLADATSLPRFLTVLACRATLDKVKEISRFEKRHSHLESLADEEGSFFSEALVWTHHERTALWAALEGLSAKERVCVELCWVDGKTHKDIAEALAIPQDTVSSILRRTRQKLKEKLSEIA